MISHDLRLCFITKFLKNMYPKYFFKTKICGARRDRTADPLLAKQTLSQLSYGPKSPTNTKLQMVGLGGLEPPTSPLSGVRSNQLSYRPNFIFQYT